MVIKALLYCLFFCNGCLLVLTLGHANSELNPPPQSSMVFWPIHVETKHNGRHRR
jgi:hypothetical protein